MGLTGGIGSGKSAVAARLVEQGAVLIDADQVAREVVAPGTEGLAEIVAAFSEQVLDSDGALDRAALGAVVFADETARRRLEAITHPRVRARTAELAAAAPDAIVVNDVPLLVEVGLAPTYHLVVVVQTAVSTRLERLARDRGMDRAEAERRIAAQADDARRRAAADVVLTNDGSLAALHEAVDELWRQRLSPYEHNLRERRVVPPHRVDLAETDPSWPRQYGRLAARIRHALAPADLRIDHIGATAVPGSPPRTSSTCRWPCRTSPTPTGCWPIGWRTPDSRGCRGSGGTTRARPAAVGGRSGCTAAPTRPARYACTCGRPTHPAGGTRC
ncbi:hypothetical protein GCM10027614_24630 [Micromonospora vulcania]